MQQTVARSLLIPRLVAPWLAAALALALATVAALALCELLMDPTPGDVRALALYLAVSGTVTLVGGMLALRAADQIAGLSLYGKTFLAAAIGCGVALLNVLIAARAMFLSTTHDLPLLVTLLVFSAMVTLFFSLRVAQAVAGRIGQVAAGIGALARGDYGAHLEQTGRDETGRLAAHVNALGCRLREAEAQRAAMERERRALTAAISHDLRTPLAGIRAMAEALDDGIVEEPAEVSRYYATMRREIERLDRMIDDLFELARLDAGAMPLELRPLALQDIAAEVVDALQAAARRAAIDLTLTVEGSPPALPLDGARMERVIANLVRNALEHTPAGGRVDVAVHTEPGAAVLTVADTGAGIRDGDAERIWERFYRGEPSRARSDAATDGAGLGLAIVRGIAEAHGGTVAMQSAPGQGTCFTVRLRRS